MRQEWLLPRERFLIFPFLLSVFVVGGSFLFLLLKFSFLPPSVPLWYTKAWGNEQLAAPIALFLLPFSALTFCFLNLLLTEFFLRRRVKILSQLTSGLNFFTSFLLSFSLYRIVTLAAAPSTLPTLLEEKSWPPLVISFLLAFLLTPLTVRFAEKWGLMDNPETHRHPGMLLLKPTPRAGALPPFLAVALTTFLFLPGRDVFLGLLLAGALTTLVGIADDKWNLNPYLRLFFQLTAMLVVVLSGVHITSVGHPLSRIFLPLNLADFQFDFFGPRHFFFPGDVLTIVWGVAMMNMLSWSNGVDGQFPGIVAVTAITVGLLGKRLVQFDPSQEVLVTFAFIIAGAILGTLPFTWHPAFLLYGFGATTFGLLLAALAILSVAKVSLTLLILSVPALDAFFAVIRRLRRGQSPVWGDREHLHHKLLDLGWGQRRVAVFYWVITGLLGGLALYSAERDVLLALFTGAILAFLILILVNLERGWWRGRVT